MAFLQCVPVISTTSGVPCTHTPSAGSRTGREDELLLLLFTLSRALAVWLDVNMIQVAVWA